MGSIELEIGGAHGRQLVGLLPDDLRHADEKAFEAPVFGRGARGIPEVREETGAGQRDLQQPIGASTRKGQLLGAQGTAASQLPDHGQLWTLDPPVADVLVAMPVAPQEGVEIPAREALDGRGDLALERQATHLTIGHDRDARLLLQAQGLVDSIVFDALSSAVVSPPPANRSRAASSRGGQSRLPTTSLRASTTKSMVRAGRYRPWGVGCWRQWVTVGAIGADCARGTATWAATMARIAAPVAHRAVRPMPRTRGLGRP
jgi:hypothetical protein